MFTYNEEKRLPFVLANFKNYGDIIILDGGSTDNTEKIAKDAGAAFYLRPKSTQANVETKENLDFIKERISSDWIYWGYVDNFLPKTLLEKMLHVIDEGKAKYVMIPMHTYLWGDVKHVALKSHGPFLFHKDYLDFSENYIHGFGKFLGKPEELIFLENKKEYTLKHFSTYNINKFVTGHMRYGDTEAIEKHRRGEKYSTPKMLAAMVRYFFIYYRSSYKSGVLGFLIALNYAFYTLMTYTKLYELERGISLEGIEEN
jgi:glycosyltransferase involved in cell wall biosynthesis